jgi:hypothetical protein
MIRPQLLCTFTFIDVLPACIGNIHKAYDNDVANLQCYHYIEIPKNIICVYNVSTPERKMRDTISINRKKETNTLYSINALNSLIKESNNGVLDKSFTINWVSYTNTLLLADGEMGCRVIKIKELSFS